MELGFKADIDRHAVNKKNVRVVMISLPLAICFPLGIGLYKAPPLAVRFKALTNITLIYQIPGIYLLPIQWYS